MTLPRLCVEQRELHSTMYVLADHGRDGRAQNDAAFGGTLSGYERVTHGMQAAQCGVVMVWS